MVQNLSRQNVAFFLCLPSCCGETSSIKPQRLSSRRLFGPAQSESMLDTCFVGQIPLTWKSRCSRSRPCYQNHAHYNFDNHCTSENLCARHFWIEHFASTRIHQFTSSCWSGTVMLPAKHWFLAPRPLTSTTSRLQDKDSKSLSILFRNSSLRILCSLHGAVGLRHEWWCWQHTTMTCQRLSGLVANQSNLTPCWSPFALQVLAPQNVMSDRQDRLRSCSIYSSGRVCAARASISAMCKCVWFYIMFLHIFTCILEYVPRKGLNNQDTLAMQTNNSMNAKSFYQEMPGAKQSQYMLPVSCLGSWMLLFLCVRGCRSSLLFAHNNWWWAISRTNCVSQTKWRHIHHHTSTYQKR